MKLCYKPIGIMRCSLTDPDTAPKFYTDSDVPGTIEVFEQYKEGLAGLEGYEHIIVIFHFLLSDVFIEVIGGVGHHVYAGVQVDPFRGN